MIESSEKMPEPKDSPILVEVDDAKCFHISYYYEEVDSWLVGLPFYGANPAITFDDSEDSVYREYVKRWKPLHA